MHGPLRHRLLLWWSGLISRHPGWVLFVSGALVVAAAAVAAGRLQYQSDRNKLIDEDLPWNRWFLEWRGQFTGTDDLVVVIDADPRRTGAISPQRAAEARRLADEIGAALVAQSEHVSRAVWRFRPSPKLMRLAPMERFQPALAELQRSGMALSARDPAHFLDLVIGQFKAGAQSLTPATAPELGNPAAAATAPAPGDPADAAIDQAQAVAGLREFTGLVTAFGQVLGDASGASRPFEAILAGAGEGDPGWEYLHAGGGRLYFVRVTPRRDARSLSAVKDAIAAIRHTIALASARHPDLEAGLTGIDVVEADETQAVTRDSTVTSIIAFGLIAALLMLSYHSVRTPLLIVAALSAGVVWTFGYLTLAVGHLQVVSVFFTVMLLGLGVAYGIHLASRFELVRHDFPDTVEGFTLALRDTLSAMGPGIFTGALTTAAAFATTCFTEFRGVGEMGHIAGVGILLCLLAMLAVFPALLRVFKPFHRHIRPMHDRWVHFYEDRWVAPWVRGRRLTLLVWTLLTAASVAAASRMTFDYNLEALLPDRVDSVLWQRRVVEAGQSIYTGTSIVATMDEARARAARLRQLASVAEVQGVGLLVPADEQAKAELIRRAWETMPAEAHELARPGRPVPPPPSAEDLDRRLRTLLGQVNPLAPKAIKPSPAELLANAGRLRQLAAMPELLRAATRLAEAVNQAIDHLEAAPEDQRPGRLARLQDQFLAFQGELRRGLDATPLSPTELPVEIMGSYIGRDGRLALEVLPDTTLRGTQPAVTPLDGAFLARFVKDLESVDGRATGVITQYYRSGNLIRRSYVQAGAIALAIVFLLVWLDFRRLSEALLCLVPVAAGFTVTFGLMYLLGMRINPANIIVLPLMFGIGVDAGVHMLHRRRQDPTGRPPGLTAGTGKAISITSYTTIFGFAALTLARHRGIQSLGFVLACGVLFTLLACWTLMPAWMARGRE